ncbi:hypothetical protein HDE80_004059 [Rhodanobacter sp. A1T4]|nr:hypothetical protein [Rhodanobacter sp. A1T4]
MKIISELAHFGPLPMSNAQHVLASEVAWGENARQTSKMTQIVAMVGCPLFGYPQFRQRAEANMEECGVRQLIPHGRLHCGNAHNAAEGHRQLMHALPVLRRLRSCDD